MSIQIQRTFLYFSGLLIILWQMKALVSGIPSGFKHTGAMPESETRLAKTEEDGSYW